jgi:hypothetical protein
MSKFNDNTQNAANLPVNQNINNLPSQVPVTTPEIEVQIQNLGIRDVSFNAVQIPNTDNQHTAVVTCQIKTDRSSFKALGVATPDMVNGATHPAQLIPAAEVHALEATIGAVGTFQPAAGMPSQNVQSNHTSAYHASAQKPEATKTYHHSPTTPISDKQLDLILSMAGRQDKDPEEVAQDVCRKPLKKCSRADGNQIIQELRSFRM